MCKFAHFIFFVSLHPNLDTKTLLMKKLTLLIALLAAFSATLFAGYDPYNGHGTIYETDYAGRRYLSHEATFKKDSSLPTTKPITLTALWSLPSVPVTANGSSRYTTMTENRPPK